MNSDGSKMNSLDFGKEEEIEGYHHSSECSDNEDVNEEYDEILPNDGRSRSSAKAKGRKRKRIGEEGEERKAERRAANRKSAFKSRLRRKTLIEDLQRKVEELTEGNAKLRTEASELNMKVDLAMLENQLLRKQHLPTASASANMMAAQSAISQPASAPAGPVILNSLGTPSAQNVVGGVPLVTTGLPVVAPNVSHFNTGGLNQLSALSQLGAFTNLASTPQQIIGNAAGQVTTLQTPTSPSASAQLQQHIGIFPSNGGNLSGQMPSNDLQSQLALLQASLPNQSDPARNEPAAALALQAIAQNLAPPSVNRDADQPKNQS